MAKEIEYEDEEEVLKEISNEDEEDLDFEEAPKVKPVVVEQKQSTPVRSQPQKKPITKVETETNAPVMPVQTTEAPQQEQLTLNQIIGQVIAALEEINVRVTKIESDLYRTRQ